MFIKEQTLKPNPFVLGFLPVEGVLLLVFSSFSLLMEAFATESTVRTWDY